MTTVGIAASNETNLVHMALSAFLKEEPPATSDVLGCACELYRVNPDFLQKSESMPAKAAREMICYIGSQWARAHLPELVLVTGLSADQVDRAIEGIKKRLKASGGDNILRDDLDLMLVRLTERALRRKRMR